MSTDTRKRKIAVRILGTILATAGIQAAHSAAPILPVDMNDEEAAQIISILAAQGGMDAETSRNVEAILGAYSLDDLSAEQKALLSRAMELSAQGTEATEKPIA